MITPRHIDYIRQSLLCFYVAILVIGYEINIYEYQPIPQIVAFLLLPLIIVTSLRSTRLQINTPMIVSAVFFGWLVFSQLVRQIYGSEEVMSDVLKTTMIGVIFFMYAIGSEKNIADIFRIAYWLVLLSSVFNLFLYVSGGHLLLWEAIYGTRYASIFFLHNFAGALFGFQLIYSLYEKQLPTSVRYIGFLLALFSIFISFSKGSIIATGTAVAITSLAFSNAYLRFLVLLVLTAMGALLYGFYDTLAQAVPRLRLESGLNERDEMWAASLKTLNDPGILIFGGGEPFLHNTIRDLGKDYLSTHNYFMDTLVTSGAPSFILLLALSCIVTYGLRYRTESRLFFGIAVYLLISVNKSRFSLGGITLLSVMLSLVFAYAIQTWNRKPSNLHRRVCEL